MPETQYDALLFVSFGGPEGPEDVIPFLENVLRGRNVPQERMLEVAEHYGKFGGVSPINGQCRQLISALKSELQTHNIDLPIYWGNRNWHPLLADTMRELKERGAKKVLAFITSGFSCYSGCRQYREDIIAAKQHAQATDIEVHKIRVFYNHPDFVSVIAKNVQTALQQLPSHHEAPHVAFTAHSIPNSMASSSDYVKQLTETCRLVAEDIGLPPERWALVYQSRSGRPQDPWLEPDISDHLTRLHADGVRGVVVSPIGFLSDHIEVLFDLDDEAAIACRKLGVDMVRAATPGVHPRFVSMVRKLIEERLQGAVPACIGQFGPNHDVCPEDCCPAPSRRPPTAGRPET